MSGLNPDAVDIARELIPRRIRLWLYLALIGVGFALGSVATWHVAMHTDAPLWLSGAQAVAAYLLVPFGLIAVANMPTPGASPTALTLDDDGPAGDLPDGGFAPDDDEPEPAAADPAAAT